MNDRWKIRSCKKVSTGKHYPLGASLTPDGVNFALFSETASEVLLELFDDPAGPATDSIPLETCTRNVHHALVQGLRAGQLYGFRVRGPFDPKGGLRFNENKLLLDPYAKAVTSKFRNVDNLLLAYEASSSSKDLSKDTRDNASVVPKAVVVDDAFDWSGDVHPDIALDHLIVYEVHVKGFTAHPSSRASTPGTYLGFVEKLPHLVELGVNAVELLPIHEFYIDDFLHDRHLTNYWGYNTIGFFAPESSYGSGRAPACQVAEFKTLVRECHRAGLEVILDVVYNHTGEGNEMGPTIGFKGIDNATYYCLTGVPHEPRRYYMNFTGCGNSLNLAHPQVIRLVMDSLRYWVEVMHVDGFRFDLASVLGRRADGFQKAASFFDVVSQDPVLSRVKLIAEPWDLGTYQVGNFPIDWSEWNGRYRDSVRKFVKGDYGQVRDIGWRLTGSADLYGDDGRAAYNSVNFITCHDGFTLADLVSYNGKHNEANGEGSRDGSDDNLSWNCGAEGETEDESVRILRRRQVKNFAVLLLSSLGTPMILGGDEFMRTQRGNNNAYCQDNELGWFDWTEVERNRDVFDFFRKAVAFNRRYSILHRRSFPTGMDLSGDMIPDITWYGKALDAPAWDNPELRTLCYQLDGAEAPSELGRYLLFFILNTDFTLQHVMLPPAPKGLRWYRVVDTTLPTGLDFLEAGRELLLDPPDHYLANPLSTVILLAR
jgi:isoamylase